MDGVVPRVGFALSGYDKQVDNVKGPIWFLSNLIEHDRDRFDRDSIVSGYNHKGKVQLIGLP